MIFVAFTCNFSTGVKHELEFNIFSETEARLEQESNFLEQEWSWSQKLGCRYLYTWLKNDVNFQSENIIALQG